MKQRLLFCPHSIYRHQTSEIWLAAGYIHQPSIKRPEGKRSDRTQVDNYRHRRKSAHPVHQQMPSLLSLSLFLRKWKKNKNPTSWGLWNNFLLYKKHETLHSKCIESAHILKRFIEKGKKNFKSIWYTLNKIQGNMNLKGNG